MSESPPGGDNLNVFGGLVVAVDADDTVARAGGEEGDVVLVEEFNLGDASLGGVAVGEAVEAEAALPVPYSVRRSARVLWKEGENYVTPSCPSTATI